MPRSIEGRAVQDSEAKGSHPKLEPVGMYWGMVCVAWYIENGFVRKLLSSFISFWRTKL
jgi:hypothetical protein